MAIRFDNATERLSRTTGLPSFDSNYTVMAWIYIVTHNGTGNGACVVSIDDQTDDVDEFYIAAPGASTLALGIVTLGNGDPQGSTSGTTFSAGTWQHVCIVRSANNTRTGYRNGTSEVTHTVTRSGRTAPTSMTIGSVLDDDLLNGRIAAIKIWTAALTVGEIAQEIYTIRPQRTADLHLWTPGFIHTDINDYSGNGRNWTAIGTLTTEDGPPVAWAPPILIMPFPATGGGAQSISVDDTGSGSDQVAVTRPVVTVADSAAGSDQIANIAASATVAESASSTDYVVGEHLTGACVGGVLRQSTANGRYLENDAGPLLLAGYHTWYNLQDGGASDPPPAFTWDDYVAALVAKGCNFTKLWRLESAREWPSDNTQIFGVQPWARTGPGNAADGHPKFDLQRFDPDYFVRLRERCIELGNAGIYVAIQLFDGFHIDNTKPGGGAGDPWAYHPFADGNNINGLDGDTDNDGIGEEIRTTTFTAAYNYQKAFIEHVIDTVNDLDNVLYEISNEDGAYAEAWQKALVDYIHTYESGLAKQHPVGMTKLYPDGTNAMLTSSNADWISPDEDLTPAAQNSTAQAWMYDTDHTVGDTTDRKWPWIAALQGYGGVWYMDPWDSTSEGDTTDDPTYELIRLNLGWAQTYAAKMDLANATPQGGLSSTGYCLAKSSGANHQYLAYQSGTGNFTLDLSATTGQLRVEWVRVANSAGTVQSGGTVAGGAVRTLTPPWSGEDAIAYLEQMPAVGDSATGTEAISIGVSLGVSDVGAGTDSPGGAAASLAAGDAGTGTDTLAQLLASAIVADSGAGTDNQSISVSLTVADTGSGVDTALALILIAIADAGSAADSLASITATITVPDAGSAADALTVAVTVSVADAGSAADAIALLTEAIKSIADSGTGVDLVLSPAVSLAVLDVGTATDTPAVTVTLTVSDAGAAADSLNVITALLVSILEAGTGADALAVGVAPFAVADAGTGGDTAGVAVTLALSDAAAGSDAVLSSVLIAVADAAAAVDAVGNITVNVPVADLGQAADVIGAVSAALAVLDTGAGVDVAVRFDSAVRIVQVVFALARRTIAFAWSARSIAFALNM